MRDSVFAIIRLPADPRRPFRAERVSSVTPRQKARR